MKLFFLTCLIIFIIPRANAIECQKLEIKKKYIPQFAKNFHIDYFENFKIIYSKNESYLVSSTDVRCDFNRKIIKKINSVALTSTTYLPSLEMLGIENKLIGFQNKKYIYSEKFNKAKITDFSFKFNLEELKQLNPDVIIGYEDNLLNSNQLDLFYKFKLPIILNYDYEETSPLARSEWFIFNASIFDAEDKAITIFERISHDYLKIKEANNAKVKLKFLVGDIQNGRWVFPGEFSDLGKLITDAGGELVLKRPSRETQSMSFEELLKMNINADVWLTNNSIKSKSELNSFMYKAFKKFRIYNYNKKLSASGANDFWEMGLARPDKLLQDLIFIINNENSKLIWYQAL